MRAEERYRALANGTPDGILRIRNDGLVLDEKPGTPPLGLLREGATGQQLVEWATDPIGRRRLSTRWASPAAPATW